MEEKDQQDKPSTEQPVEPEQPETEDTEDDDDEYELVGPNWFERAWAWIVAHKKHVIPMTALTVLALVIALPATRYQLLSVVLKKSYVISVVDADSHLPVSEATVIWQGKTGVTDANGKLRLGGIPVGRHELKLEKEHYKTYTDTTLAAVWQNKDITILIEPTGTWVPIKIIDQKTGEPVSGALLKAAGTQVRTNGRGEATIVLPPADIKQAGEIIAENFQTKQVIITISRITIRDNTFEITPN